MVKRAPGEMLLKMTGMILLVLGILMAFGGAGTLAIAVKGSSEELVKEYLTTNHMSFGQMVAGGILSSVSGVIYLAAGICGVKFGSRKEKAKQCLLLGALLVAEIIPEIIYNYMLGQFQPYAIVSMLALPALYLWGAVRNKQAQGIIL